MDEDYLALIGLVEEYKSHSEKADAEILRLKKVLIRQNESREVWEAERSQHFALLRDMEESMIHMDHELADARTQLADREENIARMRFEIKHAVQVERDATGSVSLQLSATKDETRRLRSANDGLRNYTEELEATVNEQQSSLVDLRHYASELEGMAGVAPRVWTKHAQQPKPARSASLSPKASISDGKTLLPLQRTRGSSSADIDVISDIDVEIADYSISERRGAAHSDVPRNSGEHKDRANTPPPSKGKNLAKEAALAALARADAVRPISNRGDGSFGFQLRSPTPEKASKGKSPGSMEKWAYTREEISSGVVPGVKSVSLPPPPPPPLESPSRSIASPPKKPSHTSKPPVTELLPISPSKWSTRDAMPASSSRSESKYSGIPHQVYEDKTSRSYGLLETSDRERDNYSSFRDDSDTDDAAGEKEQRGSEVRHKEYSSRARVDAGTPRRRFKQPKSALTLRA